MRYYFIAGEASGDLHGSNLIKEIKKKDEQSILRCWGGDLMGQAGAEVATHYRELAFMGFTEVLLNIRTILKNFRRCKEDIFRFKPDVLILIDYPGFNLRMAKWAKRNRYKVVYYISPQVWAWKESRVRIIKDFVDRMITILPFEKEFYKKWEYEAFYVGHPLVETIEKFKKQYKPAGFQNLSEKPVIALLPGSRKQELHHKLPIMLSITKFFEDYTFVIAKAPSQEDSVYEPYLTAYPRVLSIRNQTYDLLQQATAACVTSGTATLETALFGVPQVVCYKAGKISYHIAKWLANVKYISLVNLIMDKPVVTELIQKDLTVPKLRKELFDLLNDRQRIEQIRRDYATLNLILSKDGNASANAAAIIVNLLFTGN